MRYASHRARRRLTASQRRSREHKQMLSYVVDSYSRLMDAFLDLYGGNMSDAEKRGLVKQRIQAYAKVRARTGIVD